MNWSEMIVHNLQKGITSNQGKLSQSKHATAKQMSINKLPNLITLIVCIQI